MNLKVLASATPGLVVVAVALLCAGCDATAPTSSTSDSPVQSAETIQPTIDGQIAFEINGQVKQFDYLAADESTFTPYASSFKARPAAGSTESLNILFLSVDLSKLDYPLELPVRRGGGSSPLQLASIGFGYFDSEGSEWAGPGKVTLDSFEAGTLIGSFDSVVLPHTDKSLPDIEIGSGQFQAHIDH